MVTFSPFLFSFTKCSSRSFIAFSTRLKESQRKLKEKEKKKGDVKNGILQETPNQAREALQKGDRFPHQSMVPLQHGILLTSLGFHGLDATAPSTTVYRTEPLSRAHPPPSLIRYCFPPSLSTAGWMNHTDARCHGNT